SLELRAESGTMDEPGRIEVDGLIVAKPGFEDAGDAFALRHEAAGTLIMLVDVLGHGPVAAREARKAVAAFNAATEASLDETRELVAASLEGGRGAAAMIVAFEGNGM